MVSEYENHYEKGGIVGLVEYGTIYYYYDADTSWKFHPQFSNRPLLSTGRDTPLFVDHAQLPSQPESQRASQTQTSIGPQKRSCSAHLTQRSR